MPSANALPTLRTINLYDDENAAEWIANGDLEMAECGAITDEIAIVRFPDAGDDPDGRILRKLKRALIDGARGQEMHMNYVCTCDCKCESMWIAGNGAIHVTWYSSAERDRVQSLSGWDARCLGASAPQSVRDAAALACADTEVAVWGERVRIAKANRARFRRKNRRKCLMGSRMMLAFNVFGTPENDADRKNFCEIQNAQLGLEWAMTRRFDICDALAARNGGAK